MRESLSLLHFTSGYKNIGSIVFHIIKYILGVARSVRLERSERTKPEESLHSFAGFVIEKRFKVACLVAYPLDLII